MEKEMITREELDNMLFVELMEGFLDKLYNDSIISYTNYNGKTVVLDRKKTNITRIVHILGRNTWMDGVRFHKLKMKDVDNDLLNAMFTKNTRGITEKKLKFIETQFHKYIWDVYYKESET